MAQSICPRCGNPQFEGVEKSVVGLRYHVTFIQCTACGCVVGVLNTNVLSTHISNIANQLAVVIKK